MSHIIWNLGKGWWTSFISGDHWSVITCWGSSVYKALWKCQGDPEPSWVAIPSLILVRQGASRESTMYAVLPAVVIVGWTRIFKPLSLIPAFQDFVLSDFNLSHPCIFYSPIIALCSTWKFSRPTMNYLLSCCRFINVSYSKHFLPLFWKMPTHFQFVA